VSILLPPGVTVERGRSGTEIMAGRISRPYLSSEVLGDDYLTNWTIDKIDHMRRGDGQVAAVWKAIKLAIMQSDWDCIPYKAKSRDKATRRDQQIANFIGEQLEELWPTTLPQAINHLLYGFYLFEPLYEERGGQIVWRRFAPRAPWTVEEWNPRDGYVGSIVQYAYDHNGGNYGRFTIPGSKLLRFTNEQDGENFEGESYFRAAYKHWLMKDSLYKIAALRHERHGVGTPVGCAPPDATDEEVDELKTLLGDLKSNTKGYLYLGRHAGEISIPDMIDILVPKGGQAGSNDLMEIIRHHDALMARSMLAQFINLGENNAGTRALSSDMNDLFLMNLEAITRYIGHVMTFGNRGENEGIKTLVDMNFGGVKGYPKWVCGRTKKTDAAAISAVIAQLVQSGAMEPDDSLENFLRRLVGVPQQKVNARPVKTVTRERSEQKSAKDDSEAFAEGGWWRALHPWEQHVDFGEFENRLDAASETFVTIWRNVLPQQLAAVGREVGGTLERDDLPRLSQLEIPMRGLLGKQFESVYREMAAFGRASVKPELLRGLGAAAMAEEEEEDDTLPLLLVAQADKAAERLNDKTKNSILYYAIAALAAGGSSPWSKIESQVLDMSDGDARIEGRATGLAFGLARSAEQDKYAPLVEDWVYSAIMDRNTCEECAALDGAAYSERPFSVPNPRCHGGLSLCRCIKVAMLRPGVTAADIEAII